MLHRPDMALPPIATASGIEVYRGPHKVLSSATVSLHGGEVVAIIGENGSGKSTLIESIAGILPLRSGEVSWSTRSGDQRLVRDSDGRRNALPPMGLTLQRDGMCGEQTVIERLSSALSVAGLFPNRSRLLELLEEWGLSHRLDSRVAHISGGQRRRLALLCGLAPAALSDHPRAVLLDEPSEGLDSSSKKLMRGWLRSLASIGHGVLVSTHDNEVVGCADRVITIRAQALSEAPGDPSDEFAELPIPCPSMDPSPIASLVKWGITMELRNPIDTIGRATPALVAILLAYSLVGSLDMALHSSDLLAALILAPAFITAVASPAISGRLAEDDCGRWWNAVVGPMARPANSIVGASLVLPIPLTYLSWVLLGGSVDSTTSSEVLRWLWLPALSMLDLAVAATALHLLSSELERRSAVPASLLLVVLVWPFLELTEALAMIIDDGMTISLELNEPIATCLIASVTSALVWLVAVLIPDS